MFVVSVVLAIPIATRPAIDARLLAERYRAKAQGLGALCRGANAAPSTTR